MASQILETTISINAHAGNGFQQVGNTLMEMGGMVNQLSQQLIDFGKDSINVYKDYEKSMAEARVALSTSLGQDTKELDNAMSQLDEAASHWAATTIFHTDDVANAINEAAHAGWNLEEIMRNMPVAMRLAQAGSIDLSEALHYIVKSQDAFGIATDEIDDFIDMWVYAANSSAGNVEEFGHAMLKMGSTMRFTDSKEELFALIALMHDMGESGSTAATLLRTSMMRILAPSGVTHALMEELGATDEEIRAIREDASKVEALDILKQHGFSAFDDSGQAKPMLQIYAELGQVLAEIAGGYENITKNQTTLGILGTIFGNRGITGALNIVTALEGAVSLQEDLKNGAAAGYGEFAMITMADTLYGKTELFKSKLEELKRVAGEMLSEQLTPALEALGGFIDGISNLPEDQFNALVKGLEVVAIAGPGLMAAGLAMKVFGAIFTPAGAVGAGLIAFTAAVAALDELQEGDFAKNFGTMELDDREIMSYIQTLSADFNSAYSNVDKFRQALDDCVASYNNASQKLSQRLLSASVTGQELTEAEIQQLESLGETMFTSVMQGYDNASAASVAFWSALFGGDGAAEYNEEYQEIFALVQSTYENTQAELTGIGNNMRAALTAAFADGKLTPEEYQNILSYMEDYNAAIARAQKEAQDRESEIQLRTLMGKGQTASFDEARGVAKDISTLRDTTLQALEENFLHEYYAAELDWDKAIENGIMINGELATEERKQASLAAMKEAYTRERVARSKGYDDAMANLWRSVILSGDFESQYQWLENIASSVMRGESSLSDSQFVWTSYGTKESREAIKTMLAFYSNFEGGLMGIEQRIRDATAIGDTETADRLMMLYTMQMINNRGAWWEARDTSGLGSILFGDYTLESYFGGGDFTDWYNKLATETGYGQTPPEIPVDANTAPAEQAVSNFIAEAEQGTVTIPIRARGGGNAYREYAEGGRADIASIFGEAGPEWAIPEEHSQRTAELLNAARAASGFTWPDLIARFGGLNADAGHTPMTVIYSPVINAQDAAGVADVLREDKRRMERWLEERRLRESAEVYA